MYLFWIISFLQISAATVFLQVEAVKALDLFKTEEYNILHNPLCVTTLLFQLRALNFKHPDTL